ncbi:UvrD-helicase domain-containing protein [Candidatus Nitrosacidococcus tergens]|uniref:DNA 3'-5' helicase n=1 Tax=Candidatus Nitrosacidococcus tergens TaxID=553981 RepID=A0A7G1QAI5_9GAMM|nr:UvrD-helicase domain-containing protein [Candidatus Nitrosacidococcus tergens]CAB1276056.1 UvrD/REP helicase [Candidatus Nitrosacidococcus tergens]
MIAQNVSDSKIRKQALDPSQSFIIQAPAGSGKTELLTQRYLNLLARVDSPEEIIAITFTRKAATEMQTRIIEALMMVEDNQPITEPKKTTWALAKTVLIHDKKQGWDLLQYPNQLRIQTIDSLCAGLTQQMPWLSCFGAQPKTIDKAEPLYQQAAHHTLMLLEHGNDQQSAKIVRLLHHLNNRWGNIEELLVEMLEHRDQWLRHFVGEQLNRDILEKMLQAIISKALVQVHAYFSKEVLTKLLELAYFASHRIEKQDSLIRAFQNFTPPLNIDAASLPYWQGLAELLLIEKGQWRKSINKTIGFPPEYKDEKTSFMNLLNEIQSLEASEQLQKQLHQLRSLPTSRYEDDQWEIIQVLSEILLLAVAQLQLVFQVQGAVDFTEISQRASQALEEANKTPTDLALVLDHKISHLLVDEFQDTNLSQYLLLEKLTHGWEREDGRTLFIVGDPMQSIYLFREANVGLFLRTWHYGIGNIALTSLKLEVNFRSQQSIVDWVNHGFSQIFPTQENISLGAVPYSPSKPFHSFDQQATGVQIHPCFEKNRTQEAIKIIELIQQTKAQNPKDTIAILVSSRSHLREVISCLKKENLSFQAVEIDLLKDEEVVRDLLSLTKALFHPADRISWFSILRAPWCGLTLNDLYQLVHVTPEKTIWECIQQNKQTLSQEGRQQLAKIKQVFTAAFKLRRYRSPRQLVESTWLTLGGPACITEEIKLESAKIYLDFLEAYTQDGNIFDFQDLENHIQELYAPPNSSGELQIMTIHKSKGLEFDTVIMPGLGYSGRASSPKLLMWAEYSANNHIDEHIDKNQLILAPIKEAGGEDHPTYKYIKEIKREKENLEKQRLLYVGATRAKKSLHLLGHTNYDPEEAKIEDPQKESLLSILWPLIKEQFETKIAEIEHDTLISIAEEKRENTADSHLYKLDSHWQPPDLSADIDVIYKNEIEFINSNSESPVFDWAGNWARCIGIVVHRYLQIIAQDGIECWDLQKISQLEPNFRQALLKQGLVDQKQLDDSLRKIQNIFTRIFEDNSKGKWILSSRHQQAHNEYPLSGIVDQDPVRIIIDRTFIDEKGYRWIIDYKTSTHDGGNLDEFLDHEQERYRSQLEHYARLMARKELHRQIYLGLYYPALSGWRQWCWQNNK